MRLASVYTDYGVFHPADEFGILLENLSLARSDLHFDLLAQRSRHPEQERYARFYGERLHGGREGRSYVVQLFSLRETKL